MEHQILAAAAAKLAGRPVRIVLSREGVYRVVGGRTTTEQRVALGARARTAGSTALIHTGVAAMTAHNELPEQFTFPARHLYAAETRAARSRRCADLDMLANTFMRAPGESVGTFALECAIDELARRDVGIDPIELRRRNEPEKDPTSGARLLLAPPRRRPIATARSGSAGTGAIRRPARGATASGWSAWAWRPPPIPTTACPAAPRGSRLDARTAASTVQMAGHEMGMGTATVQTQHAADRLGAAAGAGVASSTATPTLPAGALAGGSPQTAAIGGRGRRRRRGAGRASC